MGDVIKTQGSVGLQQMSPADAVSTNPENKVLVSTCLDRHLCFVSLAHSGGVRPRPFSHPCIDPGG